MSKMEPTDAEKHCCPFKEGRCTSDCSLYDWDVEECRTGIMMEEIERAASTISEYLRRIMHGGCNGCY